MEVVCQIRLPKGRLCHVVFEGCQQVKLLWKWVRLEVVQRWKDLGRFVRWIGNIDMGSICEERRIICPRSGRWHHQRWFGAE